MKEKMGRKEKGKSKRRNEKDKKSRKTERKG